ncbi:uncharacterized protein LOC118798430 [Colossoma macropomum]|uniref:uncharacterized protein LOC118798430 n=1 Tax=Colossoma macropomum TaxID=42526 RepID=UPI001864EE2A|nr:uncharacterized protein LOC118798430 [Colossoma macropomum]
MEAEHKDKKSGKRKDRCAEGSRGPTKKRELKAAEDSGFNQLPPLRQEQEKTSQALNVAVHAQSYSVLPPIRGSCPPPVQAMKGDWLEKVGLDVHDDPSPPPPVQPEKTPELTFDLPSESLDALFSARLLGNETPELNGVKEFLDTPEHEREEGQARVEEASSAADRRSRSSTAVEEVALSRGPKDSKVLTVPPAVIRKTVEELVKRLESSFNFRVPVISLYERLVGRLVEELETLSQIRITHQVLGGRLFPDENGAVSQIVNEAYKSLLNERLMKGASCVDQWTIDYVANVILTVLVDYALGCFHVSSSSPDTDAAEEASQGLELTEVQEDSDQQSRTNESRRRSESAASGNLSAWSCSTVLSEPGLSSFEDLIRECGGSPDLSDLSDECSEIFTGYQNYRRYGHVKRPGTYLVECAESPLEGSPDLSSSIPAVQVTEVSEDSEVENNEDLETPACPDGTEDDTTSRKTKKRRLRSRVFNFLRRVFCFGCVPSRRVEPL